MTRKPFFARFLENHLTDDKAQEVAGGSLFTKKYPSDDDEVFTKKYPSDDDEIFTKKYPSDDDEGF